MGEWREIPELLKQSRFEIAAWLVTFLLTVFADLTVAVEAGMILAVLVFIRKVTQTTTVSEVTAEYIREGHVHILQHKEIPAYVSIFRIHGPFLFGATDKIDAIVSRLPDLPPIIILRLRNMTAIDSTGLQALENFADRVHESGQATYSCAEPGNNRRSECATRNFTSMWARKTSATAWQRPSNEPGSCAPRARRNVRKGSPGGEGVPTMRQRLQRRQQPQLRTDRELDDAPIAKIGDFVAGQVPP